MVRNNLDFIFFALLVASIIWLIACAIFAYYGFEVKGASFLIVPVLAGFGLAIKEQNDD